MINRTRGASFSTIPRYSKDKTKDKFMQHVDSTRGMFFPVSVRTSGRCVFPYPECKLLAVGGKESSFSQNCVV